MDGNNVIADGVVKAPPGAIFALLASAGKPARFADSGSTGLRRTRSPDDVLES
jgi:hypothetical protein